MHTRIREIIRFVIVGIIATIIHYLIYLILNFFLINKISYTIGYIVSFLCNFILTSRFTFKEKATFKKGIGFSISHIINYIVHISLFSLFIKIGLPEKIAPIPVFTIAIPINFLLVRFVFKSSKL